MTCEHELQDLAVVGQHQLPLQITRQHSMRPRLIERQPDQYHLPRSAVPTTWTTGTNQGYASQQTRACPLRFKRA